MAETWRRQERVPWRRGRSWCSGVAAMTSSLWREVRRGAKEEEEEEEEELLAVDCC